MRDLFVLTIAFSKIYFVSNLKGTYGKCLLLPAGIHAPSCHPERRAKPAVEPAGRCKASGSTRGKAICPPEILLGFRLALLRSSTSLRSAQDDTGGISYKISRGNANPLFSFLDYLNETPPKCNTGRNNAARHRCVLRRRYARMPSAPTHRRHSG